MANTINCPVCGKLTDSRLDSCPHCGAYLKSRREAAQAAAGPQKTCPRCGAVVQEGDIICVACGTNLLTGQKIVEEAAGRRRRRVPVGWLIGGLVAALLIIVVGVLWLYAATRDPLSQAQRLASAGETLEAQSVLEPYVQRVPDDAAAVLLLAKLQWQNGQYAKAADSFGRASNLDPRDPDAAVWAAVATARSDPAASGRLLDLLDRAARLEEDDPGLWYTLAVARGAAGDIEGEIEALERVIDLRATDDSAHWSLGVAQALRGNLDRARTEFLTVGEGPRQADALAGLGFVAALDGNTRQAQRRLTEALRSGEVNVTAEAHLALGKLLMQEGNLQEAQIRFENALSADPGNRLARYLRGLALHARGRFQDALNDFEQLMQDPGAYRAEAAIQAADIQLALNSPDRARRALDQAERAGADSAAYHTTRGRLAIAEGDEGGALQAFSTAVRTDPRYAAAYLERGLLNIRREALERGVADLERYLELAGPESQGTRVADVRALVEQLRQATAETSEAPAEGGTGARI